MSFSPIRVESDGTPNSLRVVSKDGEAIPCKSVHFFQTYGEAPVVTLELVGVPVDLTVPVSPAVKSTHPKSAKEKRHGVDVV